MDKQRERDDDGWSLGGGDEIAQPQDAFDE